MIRSNNGDSKNRRNHKASLRHHISMLKHDRQSSRMILGVLWIWITTMITITLNKMVDMTAATGLNHEQVSAALRVIVDIRIMLKVAITAVSNNNNNHSIKDMTHSKYLHFSIQNRSLTNPDERRMTTCGSEQIVIPFITDQRFFALHRNYFRIQSVHLRLVVPASLSRRSLAGLPLPFHNGNSLSAPKD